MTDLLLIVTIAGQRVAIPAAEVESVVEIEGLTPVPRAPGHVAGLSALRSRVLTVIDCRASLELGREEPVAGPREAIVVPRDGHPYAFLVDGVEDVLDHSGEVRPVRSALEAGWARVARGMVDADSDLLLLIDTGALLAGPAAAEAA